MTIIKRLFAFTLIISLLILTSCSPLFFKNKSKKIVGEVMYVSRNPYGLEDPENAQHYYLYVRPIEKSKKTEWILFDVDFDTKMESVFSKNLENMPELAIGATVEIRFEMDMEKQGFSFIQYQANSIKLRVMDSAETIDNPNFDLVFDENYLSNCSGSSRQKTGKLIHIAEVDTPESGYIFYVDEGWSTLARYWFSSNLITDSEIIEIIENSATGCEVEVFGREAYPFYNRDIREGYSVKLAK